MKLVHFSDLHVDEHDRYDETCRVLEWIMNEVDAFAPDLIVCAGDAAPVSVRQMTPTERNTLADFYEKLARAAPLCVIRGNHDILDGDIDVFGRLKSEHPILAADRPTTYSIGEGPFFSNELAIGVLPYPAKGWLLQQLKEASVESVGDACRTALLTVLQGIKADFARYDKAVKILVGHLNVTGANVGGFPLVGQDVEVSALDLENIGADYVALGHIHEMQMMGNSGRIWYSGSPRRVNFGEEGEEKGILCVTVHKGELPQVEFRPTQGLTPLQTIRVTYTSGFWTESASCRPGAEVRVLVECDEEQRATIDERQLLKQLQADKAKSVRCDWRVRPVERIRAPEMKEARSDADRLKAYLGTLQPVPDSETVERLLLKLSTLECGSNG